MGRDRSDTDRPNFIRVNEVYISKEHLQLQIADVKDWKNTQRTPLKLVIQSKAMTVVNGEKVKLATGQQPYGIDLETPEIEIGFREDKIRMKLHWLPLIVIYPQRVQIGDTIQSNPVEDQLYNLVKSGVDLRVSNEPEIATHYIALNDSHTYGLRIALLRGICVVNDKWIDFVLKNPRNHETWYDVDKTELLPKSHRDPSYLFPNSARSVLLKDCLVIVEQPTAKLAATIRFMGGTMEHITELSDKEKLIESVRTKIGRNKAVYLLQSGSSKSPPEKEPTKLEYITMNDLFESICLCSISNLHSLDLTISLKREADSLPSQSKRRRVKKVSKTEFFNFSSGPSQIDHEIVARAENAPDAITFKQGSEDEPSTKKLHTRSVDQSPTGEDPSSQAGGNKIKDGQAHVPESLLQDTSKKLEKHVLPVTFYEAIRSTKEKQSKSIKQDLGLDEIFDNELSDKLVDLAVVEYVPLERQTTVPTNACGKDYSGRKNFKKFKKVAESVKVHPEVELVAAKNTEAPSRSEYGGIKVVADFASEMPSVVGVEPRELLDKHFLEQNTPLFSFRDKSTGPQENSLFVNDDSQDPTTEATASALKKSGHDNDDDDLLPRFAFRRA